MPRSVKLSCLHEFLLVLTFLHFGDLNLPFELRCLQAFLRLYVDS